MTLSKNNQYIAEIKQILAHARQKAYSAVNTAMAEAYWLVGKRIVEEEQNGEDRAAYGAEILQTLSVELKKEFGKGFSVTNLPNFRKFYQIFSDLSIQQTPSANFNSSIQQTMSVKSNSKKEKGQRVSDLSKNQIWRTAFAKLSWSHFERLIRVENEEARNYYLIEAAEQNWGVRTLGRNISTLYYQRLISSQKKEEVKEEMQEKTANFKAGKG